MTEKYIVVDGLEFDYKGLFDLPGFLKTIDELLEEKGYKKKEKKREEYVNPKGKNFEIELRPVKAMSEFQILMLKLRISITDLTDAEVIVDNRKKTVQKANINLIMDGWLLTDYENRWEQKPWYWLLRGFFEKFFYKVHTNKYHSMVVEDSHHIFNNLKSYLNLHRFKIKNEK